MRENLDHSSFVKSVSDLKTVGRYSIIGKLGKGGAGIVFLGEDPFIKRKVAIKLSHFSSQKFIQRFFVEAQSAGKLNHPNIVSIYDAGMYTEYCYIAMEYVDGQTLYQLTQASHPVPIVQAVEIIYLVSHALDYAHKLGIIHRDIKPTNILLRKDGVPKITDFGTAQPPGKISLENIAGTPGYMAPELLKDGTVIKPGDIFSLGCVLYKLLSGNSPFFGPDTYAIVEKTLEEEPALLTELRSDIPESLEKTIKKALAKDPAERYQDCLAFAYDLRMVLKDLSGVSPDDDFDLVEYLQRLPFFNDFTRRHLEEVVSASSIINFAKDQVIIAEGGIGDCFYVIVSGKAKVVKGENEVDILLSGDCFGEMAYLGSQRRMATVLAATDCILVRIDATILSRSSESVQLQFYRNFASTLVERLTTCTIEKFS
jgi:serine/threonine protein kinase